MLKSETREMVRNLTDMIIEKVIESIECDIKNNNEGKKIPNFKANIHVDVFLNNDTLVGFRIDFKDIKLEK